MNTYEKKYQKIVNNLIRKSFPLLKKEKIIVKEKKIKSNALVRHYPFRMYILVNPVVRNYPLAWKGLFAHELCHIELIKQMKWSAFKTNLLYIYYILSKEYYKKTEKQANDLLRKKGYNKDLLITRKFLNKK